MKSFLNISLLLMLLIISGCWDRTEINDLAFVTGSAFDLTEEGELLVSIQIAINTPDPSGPGSGGGQTEKFFVLSTVGRNASDAFKKLQKKSSRRLFTAHRGVIFIGESLAKQGVKDRLDIFSHDPRNRLKTYIMVVKGGTGQEILQTKYPFEQVPVEAVKEMEGLGGDLAVTLRDFFIASSSEGANPVMGVIERESLSDGLKENKNKIFVLAGSAIFKDFKLVGFLNEKETGGFIWIMEKMKSGRIYADLPNGQGNVAMVINRVKRKITPTIKGDKIKVKLELLGQGRIVENNSALDISMPHNVELVQNAFEKSVEKQVQGLVAKIQKQYKVDSLGFGQEIYRNMPKQWKRLRSEWETRFPAVDVTIEAKITVSEAGMAGPPLQLTEKEIIK